MKAAVPAECAEILQCADDFDFLVGMGGNNPELEEFRNAIGRIPQWRKRAELCLRN